MTARAVLIGSPTYGLAGCDADVALVDRALRDRSFETTRLTGRAATRTAVVSALDSLVSATGPGDAAVIYYSGHGGRLVRPDRDERSAAGLSTHFQFLVSADIEDSTPGDFRGLLSEELSLVQRRLADAFDGGPANATTILDCCHSGYMARDAHARPRSVDLRDRESAMFTLPGLLDHVRSLGPGADVAVGATNPHVVRLAACQVEQSAFELPSPRGVVHGVFTDALVSVLDDVGDASVSWAVIGDLVRRRVRSIVPEQRPEVEGPTDRTLFGSALLSDAMSLPLVEIEGSVAIEAATLLGIGIGDDVRLVVPGRDGTEHTARVVEIRGGLAVLDVDPTVMGDLLAATVALPLTISVPPVGVSVGTGEGADRLAAAIEGSPRLTVTERSPMIRLQPVDDRWRIADATGVAWRSELYDADDRGIDVLVDTAEAIAVGHRLLDLPSGDGPVGLDADVELSFDVIDRSERSPIALHGERLPIGASVGLSLRNTAREERFVWVFDVGVSGRSALVTQAAASGTRLGPTGDADATLEIWGAEGTPLFWPVDVPVDRAGRPETFVVITADRRNDLSGLASREQIRRGAIRSPLDVLLDEVRLGTRDVGAPPAVETLRYRLDRVEFVLVPSG